MNKHKIKGTIDGKHKTTVVSANDALEAMYKVSAKFSAFQFESCVPVHEIVPTKDVEVGHAFLSRKELLITIAIVSVIALLGVVVYVNVPSAPQSQTVTPASKNVADGEAEIKEPTDDQVRRAGRIFAMKAIVKKGLFPKIAEYRLKDVVIWENLRQTVYSLNPDGRRRYTCRVDGAVKDGSRTGKWSSVVWMDSDARGIRAKCVAVFLDDTTTPIWEGEDSEDFEYWER